MGPNEGSPLEVWIRCGVVPGQSLSTANFSLLGVKNMKNHNTNNNNTNNNDSDLLRQQNKPWSSTTCARNLIEA